MRVDDSNRVVRLVLTDNNLRGSIPSGIGNLTSLSLLGLGENHIEGAIPPELAVAARDSGRAVRSNEG
ncbi:MAG: hypothetical protein F4Y07_15445 [Gemmatimonadetes bacterium]|nr:hypothetical protein [Gemmatimonadota bacterium]MYB06130.1 hypothetical protein [Gemmatimonadota bacterium]MYE17865.1 hypothetical protein [Gemmatimonadota bacterium]MYG22875.1 hypothetical protein [Gemmatimonadota bacterium]MYJ37791.1 hypothetical protein [Gemmatimonadota bacterium]